MDNFRSPTVYRFDNFEFREEGSLLYHNGVLVKDAKIKPLEVLSALLNDANELVLHDDVISKVWGENSFGATSARVNQYVSQLQKLLATHEPGIKFIENVRGRGYIFRRDVEIGIGDGNSTHIASDNGSVSRSPSESDRGWVPKRPFLILGVALFLMFTIAGFAYYSVRETVSEQIKSIVKDSQNFESLSLYADPGKFTESDLDKFWAPDIDPGSSSDRRMIRNSIQKLIDLEKHYGDETRCEMFEFQSVEIDKDQTRAIVKTLEKWFIAEYSNDGKLLKNKSVGPYFVQYSVLNVNGEWKVESSSTARVDRPTPKFAHVDLVTDPAENVEFLITVTGQDFEPHTIYFSIIGPGCLETKPCLLSNLVLRNRAKSTETDIENIPVTLGSGSYRIIAYNGDSPASEAGYFRVP